MSYFYEPPRPQRPPLWSYLLVAFIGALIGGTLVVLVAPWVVQPEVQPPAGIPGPQQDAERGKAPDLARTAITEAVDKVSPSVVGIINRRRVYDFFGRPLEKVSGGSGVIFSSDGYIITNNHVIENSDELTVLLADGRKLSAELVGADARTDLAVVKVDAKNLPVPEFGDSDKLKVGEWAVAIGNPVDFRFERSATAGIISGLNRRLAYTEQELRLIQTDAAINPGNSGGPLVNARGEVIGINSVKLATEEIEGMGFAIPINTVRPVVSDLIEFGRVRRPWMGVWVVDKEEAEAAFDLKIERGILIYRVVSGGPADRAGLKERDILVSLGGEKIESGQDLRRAIRKHDVGDKVEVTVLRSGRSITLQLTLGEMPQED